MVSFFSLSLSCLNAGARIIFPLAGHGFLPRRVHTVHTRNMTPHVALACYGAVILGLALILDTTGTSPLTLFGDAGTMAAFGFLFAYFMISIAAPFYLRKLGELRRRNVAIAVAAFVCLLVPTVGSFYPAPPWPVNLFPYLFLAFMLLGAGQLYRMHRANPAALPAIQSDLERALAASAHEIAVSEEEHQHHLPHPHVALPAQPTTGLQGTPTLTAMSARNRE
jgi:amino acid transporter